MEPMPHDPSHNRGYTLIELLVVLVIVGVLAMVSIQGLTPNTPKAVKSAVQELEVTLKAAHEAAIANGRDVNMLFSKDTKGRLRVLVVNPETYDASDATKAAQGTFFSHTFEASWQRYADPVSTMPILPSEAAPAKDLEPLKTLGFSGWGNPLFVDIATPIGLSARGLPQLVSATGTRTSAAGGAWIGVKGNRINDKGLPYGLAFITPTGVIGAYYKPDSLSTSTDHQWQRLE
jgi:prepilin-type N-terminal cleavage/methylation domain-containing protein